MLLHPSPVHAALTKLWAMAKTGTKMPAAFELAHAFLHKARIGIEELPQCIVIKSCLLFRACVRCFS